MRLRIDDKPYEREERPKRRAPSKPRSEENDMVPEPGPRIIHHQQVPDQRHFMRTLPPQGVPIMAQPPRPVPGYPPMPQPPVEMPLPPAPIMPPPPPAEEMVIDGFAGHGELSKGTPAFFDFFARNLQECK